MTEPFTSKGFILYTDKEKASFYVKSTGFRGTGKCKSTIAPVLIPLQKTGICSIGC